MKNLFISSSPHLSNPYNTTRRIMLDVIIALTPALIAAVIFFGYHVLINTVVCVVSCVGFELLFDLFMSKKWNKEGIKESSIGDLSAVITGMILALNLPAYICVSWFSGGKTVSWGLNILSDGNVLFSFDTVILCIFASFVAIILVKMLFGGIGKNFANPALTARIVLFIAFASSFKALLGTGEWGMNMTGATWLGDTQAAVSGNTLLDMFLGINKGSAAVGEVCILAILIGYVYLSIKKVIDWKMPALIILCTGVFALLFDGIISQHLTGGALFANTAAHMLSGGLFFGAVFMATDYATSPNTLCGRVVYCVGIALFTVIIRVFGSYPEGVSFAILIMNIVTPLLDKYLIPRPFGYQKPKAQKEVKTQ